MMFYFLAGLTCGYVIRTIMAWLFNKKITVIVDDILRKLSREVKK